VLLLSFSDIDDEQELILNQELLPTELLQVIHLLLTETNLNSHFV
jgi:hypothetical protein